MDAYVYIRIASGSMAEALAGLGAKPGIKRVVATIGDWDLLLYAKGESLGEIGNRVLSEIHQIPGVVQTITADGRSRDAWALVVNEMIGLGAEVTDEESRAIVEYLTRDFPAKK